MANGDNLLGVLFSRANRLYTVAIIMSVVALAAFLVLDSGASPGDSATVTPGTSGTTEGSASTDDLTSDECLSASQALASAAAGIGGTTLDPTALDDAFTRIAAVAPTAIRADLAVMAAAIDEFFTALQVGGIDLADPSTMASAEARATLSQATADLEASGLEAAAANVEAWLQAECAGLSG
jgi:hypothetical protein